MESLNDNRETKVQTMSINIANPILTAASLKESLGMRLPCEISLRAAVVIQDSPSSSEADHSSQGLMSVLEDRQMCSDPLPTLQMYSRPAAPNGILDHVMSQALASWRKGT